MDALKQIQFPLAVTWGIAFLALFSWFLWKHRVRLTASFVIRHLAFLLCIYLGMLWFIFEEQVTTLVFGHPVYKGSPQELLSGLVTLGGTIFWFAIAVLLLGKNRRAEFKLYVEAFPLFQKFKR